MAQLTKPATHAATRGATRRGGAGKTPSTIRPVIVGQDIQYPAGTSLRKTLGGYNYGN